MDWKPSGYTSVSPYLIVGDAEMTMAFAEAVFDATRLRSFPGENGNGIMHAEVRIDDTVVMMGEVPEAGSTNVHVYVTDVEAAFDRAMAAGASVVREPTRAGDGDYRAGVDDGNGTVWWISQMDEYLT